MQRKVLVLLSFVLSIGIFGQTSIGLGWAKNSVNAPVFRKNSVTSLGDVQYTAYYDSLGYVILAKRKLGTEIWDTSKTQYQGNINDAHNTISIAVDGNGYLHMAWDHHGHPLRYCMSTDSLGLTVGSKQSMTGSLESVVTYPEFFRLPNGDLLFIYRDGWSGNANCVVNKYSIADKKWTRLHDNLISGENTRSAYWQSCVDKNGAIHVSWVWRESPDVASNHDMCYAKSTDGGATWYKSTGGQYTIPITAATAEYALKINQNSELMNQTSIYATSDGTPYIASYWDDPVTKTPQYQLIYMDAEGNWQRKTISDRLTTFSLSGGGTKKIPISRPQILVDENGDNPVVYMIYRDSERGSKASVNVCYDIDADTTEWLVYDLTDFPVYDWEPSYDTDLWKDSTIMDIFVQKMEQGDGETLSDMPAQPVYILGFNKEMKIPVDTIKTPAIVAEKASDPIPSSNAKEISTDTILSWKPGENAVTHLVYFGTSSANLGLLEEVSTNQIEVSGLEHGKRYYWRVDEKVNGHVTKGSLWYFSTEVLVGMNNIRNNANHITIYPQPADDVIYVDKAGKEVMVDIYNIQGNKLLSTNYHEGVSINHLATGIYFLKIDGTSPVKFVKGDLYK